VVVVTCLWLVGVVQGFILGNLVYDCNIVSWLYRGCGGRDLLKVRWCCVGIERGEKITTSDHNLLNVIHPALSFYLAVSISEET
jgi:hypothetical protein